MVPVAAHDMPFRTRRRLDTPIPGQVERQAHRTQAGLVFIDYDPFLNLQWRSGRLALGHLWQVTEISRFILPQNARHDAVLNAKYPGGLGAITRTTLQIIDYGHSSCGWADLSEALLINMVSRLHIVAPVQIFLSYT